MTYKTQQTIDRTWQQFVRDQLRDIPADQRGPLEDELARRFAQLSDTAGGGEQNAFFELLGFGKNGTMSFADVPTPPVPADFDDSILASQIFAAAQLYFIYCNERMGVLRIAKVLKDLFHAGRMRIQQGPGARMLYVLEKWEPLRFTAQHRLAAYKRVFNYGRAPAPPGGIVNRNFHYQLVGLMSALAQYYRDLTIGDVIRGSSTIDQRPYGNIATIQRIALDLRYALDRASYGNIVSLSLEVGLYLKQVLEMFDAPDIKKAFDANTKWDVLEQAMNRYGGGARELTQRSKMAEAGRQVLGWIARGDFDSTVDPNLFQVETRQVAANAEAWIAAYRMTEEGQRFPGVTPSLNWAVGLPPRAVEETVLG
jgi:hypothetical protein